MIVIYSFNYEESWRRPKKNKIYIKNDFVDETVSS